jgi:putative addiction module component (TIGR02574 family)
MTTAAEILNHALALPVSERASIAHSLLQSLPTEPVLYTTEEQMAAELSRRMEAIENGTMETFPFEDTMRRAREALERSRG